MEKPDIRLEKLVLRNYKGFYTGDDENGIEITFDKHLTVFIGDNGSGKSAVLDAVALFLAKLREEVTNTDKVAGIYPFPPKSNERKNKDVNNDVEETTIRGSFNLLPALIPDVIPDKITETEIIHKLDNEGKPMYDYEGNAIEVERQFDITYEISIERTPKVELSIYLKKDESPENVTVNEWGNNTAEKDKTGKVVEIYGDAKTLKLFLENNIHVPYKIGDFRFDDKSIPILSYYGANSIHTEVQGELEEVDTSVFDAYRDALDANKFSFKQFFAWFDDQQKRMVQSNWDKEAKSESVTRTKMEFISKAISMMLDDQSTIYKNLRIDWSAYPNEMKITKKNTTTDKVDNLSISQLSSGERTLIALAADLTRRLCLANPNADNPLHGNGIVLIDEIDVHLHPKWQRKVVTKLREVFPNVQFVVTTHSPLVLNNIKPKHIRIIEDNKVFELQDKYPDFNNYGADIEKVIQLLQGVKIYSPKEVQEKFVAYFGYINDGEFEKAKKVEEELKKITDKNHPKILEGQTEIEFAQITNNL